MRGEKQVWRRCLRLGHSRPPKQGNAPPTKVIADFFFSCSLLYSHCTRRLKFNSHKGKGKCMPMTSVVFKGSHGAATVSSKQIAIFPLFSDKYATSVYPLV